MTECNSRIRKSSGNGHHSRKMLGILGLSPGFKSSPPRIFGRPPGFLDFFGTNPEDKITRAKFRTQRDGSCVIASLSPSPLPARAFTQADCVRPPSPSRMLAQTAVCNREEDTLLRVLFRENKRYTTVVKLTHNISQNTCRRQESVALPVPHAF